MEDQKHPSEGSVHSLASYKDTLQGTIREFGTSLTDRNFS